MCLLTFVLPLFDLFTKTKNYINITFRQHTLTDKSAYFFGGVFVHRQMDDDDEDEEDDDEDDPDEEDEEDDDEEADEDDDAERFALLFLLALDFFCRRLWLCRFLDLFFAGRAREEWEESDDDEATERDREPERERDRLRR